MHCLFCWINHNAAALTAIFTFLYLIATILIFNEARKSADAATEAAQAAKDNALAAKQSASAAQSSAGAASESAALMRQEFYDQADLGRSIVQTTIDSAIATIDHWRSLGIQHYASTQLPPTDDLIPATANSAVERARRISSQAAAKLSSAFDDLRRARRELETQRDVSGNRPIPASSSAKFESSLNSAFDKLMHVRALVP